MLIEGCRWKGDVAAHTVVSLYSRHVCFNRGFDRIWAVVLVPVGEGEGLPLLVVHGTGFARFDFGLCFGFRC